MPEILSNEERERLEAIRRIQNNGFLIGQSGGNFLLEIIDRLTSETQRLRDGIEGLRFKDPIYKDRQPEELKCIIDSKID